MPNKKQELTAEEAAFISDLESLLKRIPRGVCLDWDYFSMKLQVIKREHGGEVRFLSEIKVKGF